MTIKKTENGKDVTLALEGRLDTNTVGQLEAEVAAIPSEVNLVMDFTNLEYISSAGLRCLLATQKRIGTAGSFVIRNACDEIREVFDITGFSDILTVE